MLWIRERLRERGDEGFSLVEAIVSLTLIAIVMSGFTIAIVGSVKGSMVARQNQQAGDLLDRSVEEVRALGFSSVAMDPADVTGTDGGLLASCSGTYCLSVNGTQEKLLLASGGSVNPHTTTITLNNVPYTIRRYVTTPTDTEAGSTYRRLSVFVNWTAEGAVHTRQTSTLIADTRRGLPLPLYKFTPVGPTTLTVNPGGTVRFGFKLTNNGARDTWNFSTDQPTLGWTYVFDNGDNVYDAATDTTVVTDTTGDSIIDTGALEPTTSVVIWATRTVPTSPNSTYSSVAKFTVTSYAAPSYTSTLSTTVNVQPGVVSPTASPTASSAPTGCPQQDNPPAATGVTQTAFNLFNTSTTPANTTAQDPMVLDNLTAPSATTLPDYSLDDGYGSGAITGGRVLRPTTLGSSETNALKLADFRYRLTKNQTINGTVTATLWAVPQSGLSSDSLHLTFYLMSASKSGSSYVWQQRATTAYNVSSWGCGTFNKLKVALPVNFNLSNNDYLDLYVVNTGSADARIAYGTTTYGSRLVVPLS